ncbi:hypothetical protein HKX48_006438 [Thoreauomyces humboldtii]|nr:hypothetical protein HKX48_006438 [Thoreauomyces humboldtii]
MTSETCRLVRNLPTSTTVDLVAFEEKASAEVARMLPLRMIDATCFGYLMQLVCATPPACVGGFLAVPCATTCEFALQQCTETLTNAGHAALLPNCTGIATPAGEMPFPTSNCMGATSPTTPLVVLSAQTEVVQTAAPMAAFSDDGITTNQIILLCLYLWSVMGYLDLTMAFVRLRRTYSIACWAVLWIAFIAIVFFGQLRYRFDIRRAYGSEFCKYQALALIYLAQSSWVWPALFTVDVWYTVVRKKLRLKNEVRRFLWNIPLGFIVPAIPTVIIAWKANPSDTGTLQPGYGPHVLFCTFQYPTVVWGESTLPFIAVSAICAFFFGTHAAYTLWRQRRAFMSSKNGSSGGGGVFSDGGQSQAPTRAQSQLSMILFARILSISIVYVGLAAVLNYQQVSAAILGNYKPEDANEGPRDFAGAAVGILAWLVLCTSSATWRKTFMGSLFVLTCGGRRTKKSSTPGKVPRLEAGTFQTQKKGQMEDDMLELTSRSYPIRSGTLSTKASHISGPHADLDPYGAYTNRSPVYRFEDDARRGAGSPWSTESDESTAQADNDRPGKSARRQRSDQHHHTTYLMDAVSAQPVPQAFIGRSAYPVPQKVVVSDIGHRRHWHGEVTNPPNSPLPAVPSTNGYRRDEEIAAGRGWRTQEDVIE